MCYDRKHADGYIDDAIDLMDIVHTIAIIGLIITGTIFVLDYYPFVIIDYNEGTCTNFTSGFYHTSKEHNIYYYTSNIITKNGTVFKDIQGCYGNSRNSYAGSAGFTNYNRLYPYEHTSEGIPTWLCSYESSPGSFWKDLNYANDNHEKDELDPIIWTENESKCNYGSISHMKKHPWGVDKLPNTKEKYYVT